VVGANRLLEFLHAKIQVLNFVGQRDDQINGKKTYLSSLFSNYRSEVSLSNSDRD